MVQKRTRRLSWSGIEAILLVARCGTVRSAAATLGVAHSTLANRISVAERAMGMPAFVKSSTGYTLTEEGKAVVKHAELMANEAKEVERFLDGADKQLRGDVRVSLNCSLLSHIAAPAVKILRKQHPGVRMIFQTGDSVLDLDKNEADIALRLQRSPQASLHGRKLCPVSSAVYSPRETSLLNPSSETITVVGWAKPDAVEAAFFDAGLGSISIVASVADIDAQVAIAKSASAIVEIPCYIGDKDAELKRVPNTPIKHLSDLWLVTHESMRKSPRIRAVFEALSAAVLKQRSLIEGDLHIFHNEHAL